jgi:hypothetical protein
MPVKMKAGKLALVSWNFESKLHPLQRKKLGLPSSTITDTNAEKATTFLRSLNPTEFITFFLFYIAGDGNVGWSYPDKFTDNI